MSTTPPQDGQPAKLQAALDRAIAALNKASVLAKQMVPGANLYLECGGTLYAMRPEPPAHMHRDADGVARQALVFAQSSSAADGGFDVGAW